MRKASSGTVGEDRQSSNRALLSIYLSIYIHRERERERERERDFVSKVVTLRT